MLVSVALELDWNVLLSILKPFGATNGSHLLNAKMQASSIADILGLTDIPTKTLQLYLQTKFQTAICFVAVSLVKIILLLQLYNALEV